MATTVAVPTRRSGLRANASKIAIRGGEMAVGTIFFIFLLEAVLRFNALDPVLWKLYFPSFLDGIVLTLRYLGIILPLSAAIGFTVGWARISHFRTISWPLSVYVDFFRGVPPIIIVVFAAVLGPSLLPARFRSEDIGITIAALALAMHSGAYQSEIFRAGFMSVPRGQLEAAQSLGMTHGRAMQYVVLPQALRLSIPPLANEFAVVIKDTSLLAIVGGFELFGSSFIFQQQILFSPGNQLSWILVVWTAVALVYFVMTFSVTELLNAIDRRYHVKGLEAISV
jgi:His/Glu/Gln/Arg/opine family amino acid ABC transporter permease subunit